MSKDEGASRKVRASLSGRSRARSRARAPVLPRNRLPSSLLVCLLATLIVMVPLAGCGNGAVKEYNEEANQIISEVNAAMVALKDFWALPLAEQADMTKALTDYRKELDKIQQRIDSIDPPREARELDNLLRQIVDKGREMADIATSLSDYAEDMAPVAKKLTEIVTTLQQLSQQKDIPSGLLGLTAQAKQLDTQLRAVVPPNIFNGMQQEFTKFVGDLVATFQSAERAIGLDRQKPVDTNADQSTQPNDSGNEAGQNSQADAETRAQNQTIAPILEDIPDNWAEFNGQLVAQMNVVRQVLGLDAKLAEVEGIIVKSVAQITELKKKYK